jgi:hydrogenase maturation protease
MRSTSSVEDKWARKLHDCLDSKSSSKQIRFFGLGNQFKGDDSVGLYIVSKLREKFGTNPSKFVRIESPSSSESIFSKIGTLKENASETTIIFDAIESSYSPGSIVFENIGHTEYGFFATHNVPLRLIPKVATNAPSIFVLGVQPASTEVGEGLTEVVSDSADKIVEKIGEIIKDLS